MYNKKDDIYERVLMVAKYTIENKTTVRATAKVFGVSKSSIHNYLTKRLPQISQPLYKEVMEILIKNKEEGVIKGGQATKLRNLKKKHEKR